MNNISVVQPPNVCLKVDEPIPVPVPVPVATKLDLTGIKGYTHKRKSLKMRKLKADTVDELRKAFSIFDTKELQLNHSVVLFVAQVVEDIFNKPMQGDIKREIVVDVCHTFFNGDSALVEMVLELVFDKIIKTTLWRRNKQRIKNVCVFFFEIFGPSIQSNLSSRLKL
jgi:hypothetical protein